MTIGIEERRDCVANALRGVPAGQICEAGRATHTIGQLLLSMTVGGGEVLAARIARRLRDRYRFVFICLDRIGTLGKELKADGFTVCSLGRKPGIDWCSMRHLARLVRDENIGVLHAHQYTPFFYASASRLFGMRAPIVFTEHGRFFPDVVSRKRRLANRLLLRRNDRVIGVGRSVRQALIDNEGLRADRVEVIYNGIDCTRYACGPLSVVRDPLQSAPTVRDSIAQGATLGSDEIKNGKPQRGAIPIDGEVCSAVARPATTSDGTLQNAKCKMQSANWSTGGDGVDGTPQRAFPSENLTPDACGVIPATAQRSVPATLRARAELGFTPDDFIIVHVARLDPIKDHLTAIRAFERVKSALPEAKLAVVGEGPERSAIEAEIARRGLGDSVRMAGLRSDVPQWLAAADMAWLTSVSEGIPLTLIEAMAAGLPVVATDVGGVREVVVSEETALLAPAGDDAAIAAAVLRLAGDAGLCRRLGEAGRQRAFAQFSEDRMHSEYVRVYGELLNA